MPRASPRFAQRDCKSKSSVANFSQRRTAFLGRKERTFSIVIDPRACISRHTSFSFVTLTIRPEDRGVDTSDQCYDIHETRMFYPQAWTVPNSCNFLVIRNLTSIEFGKAGCITCFSAHFDHHLILNTAQAQAQSEIFGCVSQYSCKHFTPNWLSFAFDKYFLHSIPRVQHFSHFAKSAKSYMNPKKGRGSGVSGNIYRKSLRNFII